MTATPIPRRKSDSPRADEVSGGVDEAVRRAVETHGEGPNAVSIEEAESMAAGTDYHDRGMGSPMPVSAKRLRKL